MENEISQIILSCYKTNKLIFKTQGNQSMTDPPPCPQKKAKAPFIENWSFWLLSARARARVRHSV